MAMRVAQKVSKFCPYCMGQAISNKKKTFYRQVLKLGANEASAQGLQNAL
jgi:hypothetical protein